MKFSNISILFLTFYLFVLSSCEKVIYFDIETQNDKLVVNSFIGPESGAIADVSLSLAPLDNNYPEYITGATVELYKNNVFLDVYSYDGFLQKYTIDKTLLSAGEGDVFKLIASVPGKEPVTAETTIPQKIDITEIRVVDTVKLQAYDVYYDSLGYPIYSDSIPYYKIEIEFTDPDAKNYYSLQARYEDIISSGSICFSTNDPVYTVGNEFDFDAQNEDYFFTVCENSLFSDVTFNGTTKTFTLYAILIDGIFFDDAKYIFTLRHVGEDYYKYFNSVNLQQNSEGDPFAQPVTVFSNIEGGFGVFASYNESVVEVEL
ncbi:MAG: DUF4249 domain-containing protein [Chitinophagales bacterium]